ncbi:unnamed protein product [Adineta ricciae]|uniref:Uncharacterized protein n=1 Tax=Adineta ricciae TaxID=249248 RepID=A0A815V5Y0_ADIRI|nr:unnamed protein product [Adineta ricciae]CAF1641945.1 unnamed protein product [Adineta ricciae]
MNQRRIKQIFTRLNQSLITYTIGQREEGNDKNKYKVLVFYPIIDSILLEMNNRFFSTNIEIIRGISSLSPDSSTFLDIEELRALCTILQSDIHLLNNEIQVLRTMLKQSKSTNIIDLYFEILPLQQAFPAFYHFVLVL